ncbi:hypothetical protein AGLY_001091 [Aphis glycines]|uniref:Uncharacterized protein n=1 Tax=Aphis glycines TaxID=307491 RepID=A0A6G0U8U7_APHGL|nr:hypothetical protein AGLY_001091 [Aphis glycines]
MLCDQWFQENKIPSSKQRCQVTKINADSEWKITINCNNKLLIALVLVYLAISIILWSTHIDVYWLDANKMKIPIIQYVLILTRNLSMGGASVAQWLARSAVNRKVGDSTFYGRQAVLATDQLLVFSANQIEYLRISDYIVAELIDFFNGWSSCSSKTISTRRHVSCSTLSCAMYLQH